jgi:hypothetical protein
MPLAHVPAHLAAQGLTPEHRTGDVNVFGYELWASTTGPPQWAALVQVSPHWCLIHGPGQFAK